MTRQFVKLLEGISLLLFPISALAQQESKTIPYQTKLLAQEPALFATRSPVAITPQVRGVRGLNGIVLWVTDDMKSLTAYKDETLLWKVDVASACSLVPGFSGDQQIKTIVSQSPVAVIFVFVGKNAYAEVDRQTGKILTTGVDEN